MQYPPSPLPHTTHSMAGRAQHSTPQAHTSTYVAFIVQPLSGLFRCSVAIGVEYRTGALIPEFLSPFDPPSLSKRAMAALGMTPEYHQLYQPAILVTEGKKQNKSTRADWTSQPHRLGVGGALHNGCRVWPLPSNSGRGGDGLTHPSGWDWDARQAQPCPWYTTFQRRIDRRQVLTRCSPEGTR
jgi:hypothetical protein